MERLCNFICLSLTIFCIYMLLMISYEIYSMMNLNWCLGNIAECTTAVTTFAGFIVAFKEYNNYQTKVKLATLAEYNKRYSDTSYMATCLEFLTKYLNNQKTVLPSINQREMFFRFFEELQIQVEAGRLDKEKVKDLFAYYGVAAFLVEQFVDNIIEFDSDKTEIRENSKQTWNKYYQFLQENKDLANTIKEETKYNQPYGQLLSERKYQYIKNLKQ